MRDGDLGERWDLGEGDRVVHPHLDTKFTKCVYVRKFAKICILFDLLHLFKKFDEDRLVGNMTSELRSNSESRPNIRPQN